LDWQAGPEDAGRVVARNWLYNEPEADKSIAALTEIELPFSSRVFLRLQIVKVTEATSPK